MKSNDTLTAPQIADYQKLQADWLAENFGDADDFYKFVTTSTAERDEFLMRYGHSVRFAGNIVLETTIAVDPLEP